MCECLELGSWEDGDVHVSVHYCRSSNKREQIHTHTHKQTHTRTHTHTHTHTNQAQTQGGGTGGGGCGGGIEGGGVGVGEMAVTPDYDMLSRIRNRINRNQFEIWPSFPVENINLLTEGLPTKQGCFIVQNRQTYLIGNSDP